MNWLSQYITTQIVISIYRLDILEIETDKDVQWNRITDRLVCWFLEWFLLKRPPRCGGLFLH